MRIEMEYTYLIKKKKTSTKGNVLSFVWQTIARNHFSFLWFNFWLCRFQWPIAKNLKFGVASFWFWTTEIMYLQRTMIRNSIHEEPRLLKASHEYNPECERWSCVIFSLESKFGINDVPSLLQVYLTLLGLAETCNDMARLLPSTSVKTVSLRSLIIGLSMKHKQTILGYLLK